jgi:hypothetical protein
MLSPKSTILLATTALLLVGQAFSGVLGQPVLGKARTSGACVINFPPRGKIGQIRIIEENADYTAKHAPGKPLGRANGRVVIPAGASVGFISEDFMGLEKPLDTVGLFPGEALTSVSLNNNIFANGELAKLCKCPNLRRVELSATEVDDAAVGKLACLHKIESLIVDRTTVHGRFLIDFAGNTSIRHLNISHNDLDKKYLQELKNFPALTWLSLDSTHLTDSDMQKLATCTGLKFLDISNNNDLTDKGLAYLKSFKNLVYLRANLTKITGTGLLNLKACPLTQVRLQRGQCNARELATLKKAMPHMVVDFEMASEEAYGTYREVFEK